MIQRIRKQVLVAVLLSSLATTAVAQEVICLGENRSIASVITPNENSVKFRWIMNGTVITGALPDCEILTHSVGTYTYVRQTKSNDCSEWQSSNSVTVIVSDCTVTTSTKLGSTATFIDPRDGKSYKIVRMVDGAEWFAQNLNYTKDLVYNGKSAVANGQKFITIGTGAPAIGSYWCPPANKDTITGDITKCNIYGALYTWETAMVLDGKHVNEDQPKLSWDESWVANEYYIKDTKANAEVNGARSSRGICPPGWRIPTAYEWARLLDKIEGNVYMSHGKMGWLGSVAGMKLKATGTYTSVDPGDGRWEESRASATNELGFGVLPAGDRTDNGSRFYSRGLYAFFWTSSVYDEISAWSRGFAYNTAASLHQNIERSTGLSVRCIR